MHGHFCLECIDTYLKDTHKKYKDTSIWKCMVTLALFTIVIKMHHEPQISIGQYCTSVINHVENQV